MSWRRQGLLLIWAPIFVGCLGCGSGTGTEATAESDGIDDRGAAVVAEPELRIENPRVMVMPEVAAVYLDVINSGAGDDHLSSIETAAAARAETHETVHEDGISRMTPRPDGFEIPGDTTVRLEPGGKHVMLVGPRLDAEQATVTLTLHFERSGAVEVEAAVERMGAPAAESHAEHR